MTFDGTESSQASGSPVELYEFLLGAQAFRFTSGESEITFNGATYEPVEIKRSRIAVTQEQRAQVVEVDLPSSNPLVRRFINSVPGSRVVLNIRRFHTLDGTSETVTIFKGVAQSVGFTVDGLRAKVAVLPITEALSRQLPRFTFQGPCNHVLYDSQCKVVSGNHKFTGTVSDVSDNVITVPGIGAEPAPKSYVAGFVSLGGVDFRMILSTSGDDLTLLLPFDVNVTGQEVDVFEGCGHDIETCRTQFDNVENYGGFHFVPLRNPFDTGIQ